MTTLFVLREEVPGQAAHNMAVDQTLLHWVETKQLMGPVLRLYEWARPTLSLGYHQSVKLAVQLPVLQDLEVDLVRRWTGGGAVLHERELTYSFISRFQPPFQRKISANYALLGEALNRFCQALGVDAEVAATATPITDAKAFFNSNVPCFASLSVGEIASERRKWIGSAQKLSQHGFLQHGSIPLYPQAERLAALSGSSLVLDQLMVSLQDLLTPRGLDLPSLDVLISMLVEAFAAILDLSVTPLTLPEAFWTEVNVCASRQFDHPDWTFRR
jgi:lipoate-protein ligase A